MIEGMYARVSEADTLYVCIKKSSSYRAPAYDNVASQLGFLYNEYNGLVLIEW